jgi:hypothetical protein
MTDHSKCTKETEIGTLLERTKHQQNDISQIKETVNKIFTAIDGNGAPGLKGKMATVDKKMAVVEAKVASMPSVRSLITYSTIGGASAVLGVYLIKFLMEK